jgi:hypothetical protein
VKETGVGLLIHEVKIVHKGMEAWFRFESLESGFAGHLVPTVDEIYKDTGSVGWEAVSKGLGDGGVKIAIH